MPLAEFALLPLLPPELVPPRAAPLGTPPAFAPTPVFVLLLVELRVLLVMPGAGEPVVVLVPLMSERKLLELFAPIAEFAVPPILKPGVVLVVLLPAPVVLDPIPTPGKADCMRQLSTVSGLTGDAVSPSARGAT